MTICNSWIFLICILVINAMPPSNTINYIHQIIDGDLSQTWSFNFTISTKDLIGVILHCFDSRENQFGLFVTQWNNSEKVLRISFNKKCAHVNLQQICGCDPCNDRVVQLHVELHNSIIITRCNGGKPVLFSILNNIPKGVSKYHDNTMYYTPMILKNSSSNMFIMMGNSGPYVSDLNQINYPSREQMKGCLISFHYNRQHIVLIAEGSKFRSSCVMNCSEICNGGKCINMTSHGALCDCRSVGLNGPYCNKSLSEYIGGKNSVYIKTENTKNIYLKLTWREIFRKHYCLLEIIGKHDRVTISINKNHFIVNSTIISTGDFDGMNFITVNISGNDLVVETKINRTRLSFSLFDMTRINVGFTIKHGNCAMFQGLYDLHFDSSQLRPIINSEAIKEGQIHVVAIITILLIGGLSIFCITATSCIVFMMMNKIPSNSNIYDEEIIEVDRLSTIYDEPVEGIPPVYDVVREDHSEYVLPSYHDNGEKSPPLPQRNVQLHN